MKKVMWLGAILGLLALVNAQIDASRECRCEADCWCKKPGLRHFRWLVPLGHREGRTQSSS